MNKHPTIIIHGSHQSEVFLHDEHGQRVLNAKGEPVRGGFGGLDQLVDMDPLVKKAIPRVLGSVLLRCDAGLSRCVRRQLEQADGWFDENGRHNRNFQVLRLHRMKGMDEAPTSLAELPGEVHDYVFRQVPMQKMAEQLGKERMYYFAYDTMGNHGDVIDELRQFIAEVLQKHGAEKVNLLPISLGATVMNALVEYYPEVQRQLHNVVYIVPAFNGSMVVGDLLCGRLTIYDRALRGELLRKYAKGFGHRAVQALPERVIHRAIDAALEGVMHGLLGRATMLWALLPKEDYQTARARWLSDPALAELARQTDRYHQAQVNAVKNIRGMQALGVRLYNINEYNIPMPRLGNSHTQHNADGVIDVFSTSMGATSGYVDTPLPAEYLAKADPKYISPDGIVDASTGALPDTTFYFKNVHHDRTGKNEEIIRLAVTLAGTAEPVTVFDIGDGFAQFA